MKQIAVVAYELSKDEYDQYINMRQAVSDTITAIDIIANDPDKSAGRTDAIRKLIRDYDNYAVANGGWPNA